MTDATADIVIVGGGVIGTSIAMHLASMGAGRVVLVEKGHLAGGASGQSGAMVRDHYLHPVLVRMAMESSHIFHNFADAIGGDVGFTQTGRLLLFGERDQDAVSANVGMNRDLGVNIETLAPSELDRIVPNMNTDGVAVGVYEPESGYADPVATTYAYAGRARPRRRDTHSDASSRTGHIRRESHRSRDRPGSDRIASGRRRDRPLVQPAGGFRGRVAARNAHPSPDGQLQASARA